MIAYLTMLLIRIQVFYNNSLVGVGNPFYLHSLIHIIRFVLCLLSCDLLSSVSLKLHVLPKYRDQLIRLVFSWLVLLVPHSRKEGQ